jgi:iron complex transport system permease protein
VGAFYTALIGLVLSVVAPHRLNRLLFWLLGGLDGVRWSSLRGMILPLGVGLIGLWKLMEPLNVLNAGETSARSMGIDVGHTKRFTLVWVALITATAVSVSGVIGFVGLIVPHVNRMLFTPDHRELFPLVFLTGGFFLIGADLLARTLVPGVELRVGIITALAGVPFFLYLLRAQGASWG